MDYLRQTKTLARFVLVWFVMSVGVANIRVARQLETLGKNSEMYLMVNNLFDKSYAYTTGYTMPGRNARIGLITRF